MSRRAIPFADLRSLLPLARRTTLVRAAAAVVLVALALAAVLLGATPGRPRVDRATQALERDRRARPLREHLHRHVRADRRLAPRARRSRAAASASSCSPTPRTRRSPRAHPRRRCVRSSATSRCAPRARKGFLPTFPANPWANSFSAGTKISTGLELARGVIIDDAPAEKPAVLLISDLEDDPADVPRVTSLALAYRREGIPLDIVGLNPSPADEQLYRRLVRGWGSYTPARLRGEQSQGASRGSFPARPCGGRPRGRAAARRVRALVGAAHVGEPRARGGSSVRASRADRGGARARPRDGARAARGRRAHVARHDARRRRSLPALRLVRGRLEHLDLASGRRVSRECSTSTTTARCGVASPRSAQPTARAASRRPRVRGAAEATLAGVAAGSGEPAQASQAFDLLGILAFSDSTSGRRATPVERSLAAFENAVRRDPDNTAAKYNLELLLRLLEAEGERRGPNAAPGPARRRPTRRGHGRRRGRAIDRRDDAHVPVAARRTARVRRGAAAGRARARDETCRGSARAARAGPTARRRAAYDDRGARRRARAARDRRRAARDPRAGDRERPHRRPSDVHHRHVAVDARQRRARVSRLAWRGRSAPPCACVRRSDDVPAGVGTLTDRALPNLLPIADAAAFDATVERAIGIERPPPQEVERQRDDARAAERARDAGLLLPVGAPPVARRPDRRRVAVRTTWARSDERCAPGPASR